MSAKTNQKIIEVIGGVILISFLFSLVLENELLYFTATELIGVIIAANIFILAVRA